MFRRRSLSASVFRSVSQSLFPGSCMSSYVSASLPSHMLSGICPHRIAVSVFEWHDVCFPMFRWCLSFHRSGTHLAPFLYLSRGSGVRRCTLRCKSRTVLASFSPTVPMSVSLCSDVRLQRFRFSPGVSLPAFRCSGFPLTTFLHLYSVVSASASLCSGIRVASDRRLTATVPVSPSPAAVPI